MSDVVTAPISSISEYIGRGVRLSAERFARLARSLLSGRVIQVTAQNEKSRVKPTITREGTSREAMAGAYCSFLALQTVTHAAYGFDAIFTELAPQIMNVNFKRV